MGSPVSSSGQAGRPASGSWGFHLASAAGLGPPQRCSLVGWPGRSDRARWLSCLHLHVKQSDSHVQQPGPFQNLVVFVSLRKIFEKKSY